MGLDRSPGKGSQEATKPVCLICKSEIKSSSELFETICRHEFHKKCIDAHFKKSDLCLVCKVSCRPVVEKCLQTRSQSKGRQQGISDNTPGPSESAQSNNNSVTDQATAINTVTMVSMERRLFSLLSEKITDLFEKTRSPINLSLIIFPRKFSS